ncbi:uncharacterized protein LOC116024042 [Ipomoea triloba]|uniref:uncharacterized protein LOC116024042 n=1 Tax=Ipomoea triloba TaxID=35885 RepID=UPI00125DFD04|nr:uncharacterized protein LOC116024042 [Ipomoea triloba]
MVGKNNMNLGKVVVDKGFGSLECIESMSFGGGIVVDENIGIEHHSNDGLNDTNVVLIPKKSHPEVVSDLRPIALCNVVYKIMAKMIANKMKPMVDGIISESQSAFIPDRLLTDNILIAAEVGHFLNRKQNGVVGWAALKLDMAKAYDRMEWPFMRGMLLALGFAEAWLMESMLVRLYHPGASDRETLYPPIYSLSVQKGCLCYCSRLSVEEISMVVGWLGEHHLCLICFFADDSLLFFKANVHEAGAIKRCLSDYEAMSGQAVNFGKSSVCFSRNTSMADREEVVAVLGVSQAPNFGKYLGLPSFVGRNKRVVFSYIEDKIKQRFSSWNKRLISRAGKEVLLKSVAQSMPTFSMSVFLLPQSICQSIERAMNRYWWGSGEDRSIHWMAWNGLCVPKKYGGLGFKDLRAFNLAMLGKQAWRFLINPQSLVARIYKARYYPKSTFVDATIGGCPSFCWRSIMAAHELICFGVRRRIGNGDTTLIWGHPWLPDDPSLMVQTHMPPGLNGSLVSGLVDPATNTWDQSILQDIFQPQDVERILSIPISLEYEDSWYWHGDPRGCYTVKDGYRLMCDDFSDRLSAFDKWLAVWKIKSPPKWKTFLWRALNNVLPTTTNLILKRVDVQPTCPMCGLTNENVMHSLVMCDFSKLVWHEAAITIPSLQENDFAMWFSNLMTMLTMEDILVAVAVIYHIWIARNSAVWKGCLPRPVAVSRRAEAALQAWKKVHHVHRAHQPTPPVHTHSNTMQVTGAAQSQNGDWCCYFDAGYLHTTRMSTAGAVLYMPGGVYSAAFSGRTQ